MKTHIPHSSVDVIVPCYRYGHFLRHCVESILAQTGVTVRVLVLDDASPDNTAEVAAELVRYDARVELVRHAVNKGHIATYNEGIEWVSAKYMLLLSADDYLLPLSLRRATALMDEHPDVTFTFGNVIVLHNSGAIQRIHPLGNSDDIAGYRVFRGFEFIHRSGAINIVSTPTALVRTDCQKLLGGYRGDLPHTADMEMWLRLAACGSVGFVDAYQAVYRRHACNMSAAYTADSSLPDVRQRKAALDAYFGDLGASLPNSSEFRRSIFHALGDESLHLASASFNMGQKAITEQLIEFALNIAPDVKHSHIWKKLVCKRALGLTFWRLLQRTLQGLRQNGQALEAAPPSPAARRTRAGKRTNTLLSTDMVTTLAFAAQRMNLTLPQTIRTPLRALLLWFVERGPANGVEDWSKPLIAREGCEAPQEHTPRSVTGGPVTLRVITPLSPSALRSLLVTSSLDAGGMDEVVAFLARRLRDYGIRTAVLHALDDNPGCVTFGRLGRALTAEGIETVCLRREDGTAWIRAWQPDVISAHDAPSWVLHAANESGVPYVETLHGMHSLFSRNGSEEAARSTNVSMIVAVSDLVRRQYLGLNPVFPTDRIVTIPNGVDDIRRAPGNREQARTRWGLGKEFVFVSLSRHCLQKNTYGLLVAFAEIARRRPDAHLIVAGRADDPVYFQQVLELRRSLPCRARIHLRDHSNNPAELLALADTFVLNSFFEGWALASMEALYAGVPVVLSEVGGAREQVGNDERRGQVVANPLGDPLAANWNTIRAVRYQHQANREAFVAAMEWAISKRVFHLAWREWLREDSAGRFHPSTCVRQHAELLTVAANAAGEAQCPPVSGASGHALVPGSGA